MSFTPRTANLIRTGFVIAAVSLTSAASVGQSNCSITLRDVTRQTGIDFVHTDGSSGQRYIVETVSCGLALLDYDGDGDVDVYFVNGSPLPGAATIHPSPKDRLYRNDGNWKFTDVTEAAGVGDTGYGLGVCTADYDNDGDQDIFISNFGPNVCTEQRRRAFTDVTAQAGLSRETWSAPGLFSGHRWGRGLGFVRRKLRGLYV
jgi:hypothetical protein